jgi:hypothetical protein
MSMFYGYAWVNSYGEADNGTWLAGLCDIEPEMILRGIECCRVAGKTWPPSLPEFRKMCLPPIVPPYHVPYQSQRRLEKEIDWGKQREKLAEVKAKITMP